jgi:hypothetical protein
MNPPAQVNNSEILWAGLREGGSTLVRTPRDVNNLFISLKLTALMNLTAFLQAVTSMVMLECEPKPQELY